jgi:hypothetical protein
MERTMSAADHRQDIKVIDDPASIAWFNRMQGDALWFLGQTELVQRHAGGVVVLYNRQIVGRGEDSLQAKEDARLQFEARGETVPSASELLFVPLPAQPAPVSVAQNLGLEECLNGPLREGA